MIINIYLLIKMNDIINDNEKILSHIEINHTHDLQNNRWNWMAIISAIPKSWKKNYLRKYASKN